MRGGSDIIGPSRVFPEPPSTEPTVDFDLDHSVALLERTPALLRTWLADLPPEWTHRDEGPDTWRPFDVVGHLIDGEEHDWMVRTRIILTEGDVRRFEPFDRTRHLHRNRGTDLGELLERFAELRAANLSDLRRLGLTANDLARTGEHPEFGTVTLAQLLATWVAHDLTHVAQIARVMAHQYDEAVGPWKAYLSVLRRRGSGDPS